MPISGTEAALASALHAAIKAKMSAATGYQILKEDWLQAFCEAVSETIIPHLVANTQVNTGQHVTSTVPGAGLIDSMSGPVSGAATGNGNVDSTGTIS